MSTCLVGAAFDAAGKDAASANPNAAAQVPENLVIRLEYSLGELVTLMFTLGSHVSLKVIDVVVHIFFKHFAVLAHKVFNRLGS